MTPGASAPLFILSFRHRDELTRVAEGAGWQPIAARRTDNAESRFVASGASVAVVDGRGALPEGHHAVRVLADTVEANAAAMLVLVSRNEEAALDRFLREGATHFLASPFGDQEFVAAVQFAQRHAERVGNPGISRRTGDAAQTRKESWRWQPGSTMVELSPALARKAGFGNDMGQRASLMEVFRKLDPEGRKAARGAIDRVISTGRPTAFAHGDKDGSRLAHHLRLDGDDGGVVGTH